MRVRGGSAPLGVIPPQVRNLTLRSFYRRRREGTTRQHYVEDDGLSASPAMPPLLSAKRDASRRPAGLLLGAHLAGCLWYFPPREICSGEPLLTSDYVFHYLEASRVAGYLWQGWFLGYCTTWAA